MFRLLLTLAFALTFLSACDEAGWDPEGDGSSGQNPNNDYYFGPNDVWELVLRDDDTFRITRKAELDATIFDEDFEGSYETLANGYTRLTVDEAPSGINTTIMALILDNDSVILQPIEQGSRQVLVFVSQGECPESNTDGVWVQYKFENSADTAADDQSFFGIWRFNPTNASLVVFNDYNLVDMETTLGGFTDLSENCDEGLASDETYAHFYGNNYAALNIDKDDNSINQYFLGLPSHSVGSTSDLNHNYVGFMYDGQSNTNSEIAASCTDGDCFIYNVENVNFVEYETSSHSVALVDEVNEPATGFVTGTWENIVGNTGNIACATVFDLGDDDQTFLACVAQFPAEREEGDSADAVNLFLLSNN